MDRDSIAGDHATLTSSLAVESNSAVDRKGHEAANSAEPSKRRRWPRFAMDIPIQLQLTTQGPTKVLSCTGHGTDISYGGLAVTANIDLPVGAEIRLAFTHTCCHRPLSFRGVVRNRDENCYGVQFITENDEDYRNAAELEAGLTAMNAQSNQPK